MSKTDNITPPITQNETEVSRVPVPTGYRDEQRYRQRVTGTGYGRSSGYARNRQYVSGQNIDLFRFD